MVKSVHSPGQFSQNAFSVAGQIVNTKNGFARRTSGSHPA
jgi:hypothetical protein